MRYFGSWLSARRRELNAVSVGPIDAHSDRGDYYGPERIRVTSVDQQDHMAESRKRDRAGPIHVHFRLAYYHSRGFGNLATISKRGVHALQDAQRSRRRISFGHFRIAQWLIAAGNEHSTNRFRYPAAASSSRSRMPAPTSRSFRRMSTTRRNGRLLRK